MSSSFLERAEEFLSKEELLQAYSSIDPTIRRDALIQKLTREQMAEMMDDLPRKRQRTITPLSKALRYTKEEKKHIYAMILEYDRKNKLHDLTWKVVRDALAHKLQEEHMTEKSLDGVLRREKKKYMDRKNRI